ncbi:MAG: hypothetical protein DME22_05535 [Verrucomicrobia bacterium]|nr:MAG: hypothetical protein DME22_05535 [Verrucomicrobiota bacterium]
MSINAQPCPSSEIAEFGKHPVFGRQSAKLYTASRIAAALGRSRQALHAALQNAPASGALPGCGGVAKAWTFDALPQALRADLAECARQRGYRDAEHLLSIPPKAWQPPIPLNEIAPHCLEKADNLRRALAPVLARLNVRNPSQSELAAVGVQEYDRVFGHSISARHWRMLFERTLKRDAGAEHFDRLEIYLDDRLARKDRAPVPAAVLQECHDLERYLASFKDPQSPTADEQVMLWVQTFQKFEEALAAGKPAAKQKRQLCEFLLVKAPFIADTFAAVRIQFERKFRRWTEGGRLPAAIEDQRPKKSGWHRAPKLTDEDRDKIIGHSVFFNGRRIDPTWRDLFASEGLSEDLAHYYMGSPNKTPKSVRDQVRWDVAALDDIHHGPRQAKLNGAFISRDWSCVAAGDWYQADDATLPIYYSEPDGKGWFRLIRGQLLLMIDLRSTCILGYALLSDRNYNSLAIRTLITRTCDEHGLPRQGFYFERGIWQNSRLIKGIRNAGALSWPEAEKGLCDLGLRFIHARLPRAKPVERVIGAMQNLMEGIPGYAGRDERHDCFERLQELKRQVENRKINPEGQFLSAEQWLATLDSLCASYNAASQNGKMTEGLSPSEAFQRFQNKADPQVRFDARCRYLLAHHRRPVRVTRNGITLRFGKNAFNYRNESTGRLIGQTVLAWFNPEAPDILPVSDMDRRNLFAVERSQEVPAIDASGELLGTELARVAAHQSHAKTYYRMLRNKFAPAFRRNLMDHATGRLGDAIEEQSEAMRTQLDQRTARLTGIQRKARELGMSLDGLGSDADKVDEGLTMMLEAERQHKKQTKEANE